MRKYDLVDIALLETTPRTWTEVEYANMGRARFRIRTGRNSSFPWQRTLHQMVRVARGAFESNGQESPWDGDYERKPLYNEPILPPSPPGVTPGAAVVFVDTPHMNPMTVKHIDWFCALEIPGRDTMWYIRPRDLLAAPARRPEPDVDPLADALKEANATFAKEDARVADSVAKAQKRLATGELSSQDRHRSFVYDYIANTDGAVAIESLYRYMETERHCSSKPYIGRLLRELLAEGKITRPKMGHYIKVKVAA